MTEALQVRQSDIEWLRTLHIPGADKALEELKDGGEIVVAEN